MKISQKLSLNYHQISSNMHLISSAAMGTVDHREMSSVVRKPVFDVSEQARQKLGCTSTKDD